ncbi:hypothetical protein LINGRAPRIM_LOCUS3028 [Linum grandiflorum]
MEFSTTTLVLILVASLVTEAAHHHSPPPAPTPLASLYQSTPEKNPIDPDEFTRSPTEAAGRTKSANEDSEDDSSSLSSGKKAGIAVGVVVAVSTVGFGGLVYHKRQQNMRRAQ